jgi:hypothetical protein
MGYILGSKVLLGPPSVRNVERFGGSGQAVS